MVRDNLLDLVVNTRLDIFDRVRSPRLGPNVKHGRVLRFAKLCGHEGHRLLAFHHALVQT